MTILQIAILAIAAIIVGQLRRGRQLTMLAVSIFAIFWLQPGQSFITLLFWLPVATVAITVIAWAVTSSPESRGWRQNWPALAVILGVILLVDLNRYLKVESVFTSGTPVLQLTLSVLLGFAALTFLLLRWQKAIRVWQIVTFLGIIGIFIFLKTPDLSNKVLQFLTRLRGADIADKTIPIAWLGFSYIAFRLLHTIRDRQTGRLPSVTLGEYINYAIFFPSFTAGPIDRLGHFVKELREPLPLANDDWLDAGTRLFVGLFKKFVLADFLAVISINNLLVSQTKSTGWLWVFLYAYAFRIYLDFSGYTDVAIGIGRLMGIRLPENFTSPYLKPNLSQFWNSWHITLTQWFRSYFFNPLTRAMRSAKRPFPVWGIILFTQVATMTLIALWHGVAASFVAWGLWHGFGLFIHNRWSDFSRNRMPAWTQSGRGQAIMNGVNVFLTFNFVTLGWLFFELSTPSAAWQALLKLFGLS